MQKKVTAIAVIIVLALAGIGAYYFTSSQTTYSGNRESIKIGVPPLESAALIHIAKDQHFFAGNGLNVTIKNYEPAIAGIDGILTGVVDLAGVSEYAVVVNAFRKENISIIASGDEIQSVYLIGRRDRGIENVTDLKGKKIGIPLVSRQSSRVVKFMMYYLHNQPRRIGYEEVHCCTF
jgi:NitT/TauT family transport system substrate-binding protein